MLDAIFITLLNMSISASFVILFVLIARLLLRRAPRIFSYALWSVVFLRLICPLTFELPVSLVPVSGQTIPTDIAMERTPKIASGIDAIDRMVNPALPASDAAASANPLQIWQAVGEIVWLAGIAVILLISLGSLVRLNHRLIGAMRQEDGIYISDKIAEPFVMGLLRPKIYLPDGLSEDAIACILPHERTHIRRGDHIIKAAAFAIVTLHWFNPLVWLAFLLMVRDMEMSCDEAVLNHAPEDIRCIYSRTLLGLAGGGIAGCFRPAFGENSVKGRILNIMRYKKPTVWAAAITALAVLVLAVSLMASPVIDTPAELELPAAADGEPVTLTIDLPEGWEASPTEDSWEWGDMVIPAGLFLNCYDIYDGETFIASVNFDTFQLYDGWEEMDDLGFANMVYCMIHIGNHYFWDGFETVAENDGTIIQLPTVYTQIYDPNLPAAAWEAKYYDGISAYNAERLAYVCIQFAEDVVTDEDRLAIAQSMKIE
ncbi:MAG: hypothetical protein IJ493_03280 [Clostridia bacterium]|nr:hypothetical protein [Clostridia bacterium]